MGALKGGRTETFSLVDCTANTSICSFATSVTMKVAVYLLRLETVGILAKSPFYIEVYAMKIKF